MRRGVCRLLSERDLYFLVRYVLSTRDWDNPEDPEKSFWDKQWWFDRARECQFEGDKCVKIWARGHGKSTLDSFGELIRRILENQNITIGLFSITGKVARNQFLFRIMWELESNEMLKGLFPDKLYWDPKKESPRWSILDGILVRRTKHYPNATVEAHGLVDGNYTGARYSLMHYDDMVNEKTVNTPDMIEKSIAGFELSQGCFVPGGTFRVVGTFYSHDDPYVHLVSNVGIPLSLHACYDIDREKSVFDEETGLPKRLHYNKDKPVYLTEEAIEERRVMVGSNFPIQFLCDPNAGLHEAFKEDHIRYYHNAPGVERVGKNIYILVDPANEKKRHSAYTSIWVVGAGPDRNFYVLDGVRAKLNLLERTDTLFSLVHAWNPIEVRYERYGLQSDIQHIEYVQNRRQFRFNIEEVGGIVKKDDRIRRLIPLFSSGRIYFPFEGIEYVDEDGKERDLVRVFINDEYLKWPNSVFKDMLDCLARIEEPDMPVVFPHVSSREDVYTPRRSSPSGDWMAA